MYRYRRGLRPLIMLALASLLALAACDDDEPTVLADGSRPSVTFRAGDGTLQIPSEISGGLVDITFDTEAGELGHHLAMFRLADGVSYEEFDAAPEAEQLTLGTFEGGNGTIAAGEDVTMTFDLLAGEYIALDINSPPPFTEARFVVTSPAGEAEEPEAEGTITMGPGMLIDVPDDFDGTGVWRFENVDESETHEAALVKLADGATIQDLVEFSHSGEPGPGPTDGDFGSMGALGPGQQGWIEIEPGEPGTYALVCFVPGTDGVRHLAKGMVTEVEIA